MNAFGDGLCDTRPKVSALNGSLRESFNVTAAASVEWHELVRRTLGEGIAGLENLALIPGSVGAAPFQNIGAYGRELAEVLESVEVLDRHSLQVKTLSNEECGFGYRSSTFKEESRGKYVILAVTLCLGNLPIETSYQDVSNLVRAIHSARVTPTQIAEFVINIRRWKLPDPRQIGNVGSFFKNPIVSGERYDELRDLHAIQGIPCDGGIKLSAAQLIEKCGWRGYKNASVGVWSRTTVGVGQSRRRKD